MRENKKEIEGFSEIVPRLLQASGITEAQPQIAKSPTILFMQHRVHHPAERHVPFW